MSKTGPSQEGMGSEKKYKFYACRSHFERGATDSGRLYRAKEECSAGRKNLFRIFLESCVKKRSLHEELVLQYWLFEQSYHFNCVRIG